jgi:CRP-like cAMP-binding protein
MQLFLGPRSHPRVSQLKKVPLFAGLSRKQLDQINNLLHERLYLRDEFIFDEGDEGQALFIVLSGKVRTWRQDDPSHYATEFGPGEFFGELALLEGAPRATEARAVEDSVVVALFRTDFLALLDTQSKIASKISYALALDLGRKLRRVIASGRIHPQTANSR